MNNNYQYILFDLDGTLTDSGPGIINGFIYAIDKIKGIEIDKTLLKKFVGPSLKHSFNNTLGFSLEETEEAIKLYREYYNQMSGVFENKVYPGIDKLLSNLKSMGKKLIIVAGFRKIGSVLVFLDR